MNKKSLVTVVTENRLMADTIARAIDANEVHDGFYYGNGYAVTWTNGEIIEAIFKSDEPFILSSNQDMRQMYAHHFEFFVRDIDALLGWEKSKEDASQLNVIKALWAKSSVIINAMEPTFESELAFQNLYWYLRMPVVVKRAWLPRLRKQYICKAVKYGVNNTKKYEAWLNESLINFFLEVDGKANKNVIAVQDETPEEVTPEGVELIEVAKNTSIKMVQHKPLHNMLTLWMESTIDLGYEFDKTFSIAHKLYAKGLISYPSLYQNGIPESVSREMEKNMRVLEHNPTWGHLAKEVTTISRRNNFLIGQSAFNGHGIVTTGLHPTDLTADEWKLYNLIVKRVIDAFTPDAAKPVVAVKLKKKRKFGQRKFYKKHHKKAG